MSELSTPKKLGGNTGRKGGEGKIGKGRRREENAGEKGKGKRKK